MEKKKNIFALVGFILSLTSIITFGITSFIGLIFSLIGLILVKDYDNDKKGMSIAGVVISSVMLLVLFSLLINSDNNEISNTTSTDNKVETSEKVETKEKEETKKKIDVVDLSNMTRDEIQIWCNNNKIICKFNDEYNDTIENGKFISQSSKIGSTLYEGETLVILYSKGPKPSVSKLNALGKAQSYLRYSAFSYKSLIEQLEYEQFPHEDAVWAVDNCGADWNEQAVKKAQSYLKYSNFSHGGLVEQLEYEGFTHEQAEYGVSQNGL